MKKFALSTIKSIAIFLASSLVAVLLLFAVYSIPVEKLTKNARESCDILLQEGSYKKFFKNESYQLDNFTDSVMLNEAIYKYDGSSIGASMLNYIGGFDVDGLNNYLNGSNYSYSYSRYWHGYLIFLKPLLLLFNIRGIRIINLILQILLVGGICFALWKKQKKMILPYLSSLLFINPFVISQSMQFSCVYYLMNISFLIIVLFYDKLKQKNWLNFAFLLFGIVTCFFDLLTYPVATLIYPLVAVLWFDESETIKDKIILLFKLCVFWCIGFFGFWILKWAIGSILTKQNLFKSALSQAKLRINGDVSYAPNKLAVYFSFILNLYPLLTIKNAIILALLVVCFVFLFVKHKKEFKISKSQVIAFVLVALITIVWQLILHNHSYQHYWFTFRAYAGTLFALISLFAYGFKDSNIFRRNVNEKENSSNNSMLQ